VASAIEFASAVVGTE